MPRVGWTSFGWWNVGRIDACVLSLGETARDVVAVAAPLAAADAVGSTAAGAIFVFRLTWWVIITYGAVRLRGVVRMWGRVDAGGGDEGDET